MGLRAVALWKSKYSAPPLMTTVPSASTVLLCHMRVLLIVPASVTTGFSPRMSMMAARLPSASVSRMRPGSNMTAEPSQSDL